MSGGAVRHLYVHLPFCASRCGYCDFVTVVGREGQHRAYVDALLAVRVDSAETCGRVRSAIATLVGTLETGCLGQLSECFESEPPFHAVGAPAQANAGTPRPKI